MRKNRIVVCSCDFAFPTIDCKNQDLEQNLTGSNVSFVSSNELDPRTQLDQDNRKENSWEVLKSARRVRISKYKQ